MPPFKMGYKMSQKTRRRLSEAHKGHKQSEETKRKISETKTGVRLSEEHKKRISEGSKGPKGSNWRGGIWTPQRKLFLDRRRKARKRGAAGSHTQGEWELLKKQYGYTCPACGRSEPEIKLTEDHIIPLDKGGLDYIENIQPLCRSCNSIKSTKVVKYEI